MFLSRVLSISALTFALCAPLAHAAIVQDAPPPAALPDNGHATPISALAYAPDGVTVWSVDKTGELLVRSRDGKTTLFREKLGDEARGLRVLSDGSFLVGQNLGMVLDLFHKYESNCGV